MHEVTAETITDEQVRAIRARAERVETNDVDLIRLCSYALGWPPCSDGTRDHARGICAAAWNAQQKASLAEIYARLVDRGVTPEQAAEGVAAARESGARRGS